MISNWNITAIVRKEEKAQKLKQLGVNAVVGSHNDASLVEKLAAEADIVITAVSCPSTLFPAAAFDHPRRVG
jgi:D-arabinose 1-dehydrogenase-like Zn-dependent alcohol dehydrogenase